MFDFRKICRALFSYTRFEIRPFALLRRVARKKLTSYNDKKD